MGFNLDSWKAQIADYFKTHAPLIKQAGADTLYGLLAAGALLPVVVAAQQGDMMVEVTLVQLLGNVGAGLIVNLIQDWEYKTDEQIAWQVLGAVRGDVDLRNTLDELLRKLDVIKVAEAALPEKARREFRDILQAELKKVGSSIAISEDNMIIMGSSNINIGSGNVVVHLPDPGVRHLYQLPDVPADFVGRVADLDELCTTAPIQGVLICGLTGLGGIGKTTLGLVLAHRMKSKYPDGQLYLHLRGASNNPMTPAAALEQLIRAFEPVARLPEDVEQLANIYRTLLTDKQILVFLDDARDAAQVRALLPPRPALAIVTSRRRFDLAGYHTRDVSALPLEDAVKLICAVWGQTGEVTALAQRCGCLPMALRAAGALLRRRPDLTPADVDKLLTDAAHRLALADPERETTVAAAFQASYDQLTDELQTRWRALGIFPADFDAPAAAAVWEQTADPGETLAKLHAAGLVDAVTGGRWRLHDLARDFTRALCPPAELDALAYRHAAYYQKVLAKCDDLYLKGSENILAGLARFDRERTHIEAGQAWAAAHPADPAAARLCNDYPNAGAYVLPLRLHPRVQIAWLEAALQAARALGNRGAEGAHLSNLGLAWNDLGEPHRAIEYYEQQLDIAREIGDKQGEGMALGNLGNAWTELKELNKATEYLKEALSLARDIGDRRSEGRTLNNLGVFYKDLGDFNLATDYYEQALIIHHEIGDLRGESNILNNLGSVCQLLRDGARSLEYYERALIIDREIGDRRGEAVVLRNIGTAWAALGEQRRAIDYYEQGLVIAREIGDRRGEGNALGNLGNAWADLGEQRRAIDYYEQGLVIAREIGDRHGEGNALGNLGNAWAALGEPRRAIEYYEQARALRHAIGDRQGEANDCWNLGLLLEGQGELPRAVELMQVAVDFYSSIGHPDAMYALQYFQDLSLENEAKMLLEQATRAQETGDAKTIEQKIQLAYEKSTSTENPNVLIRLGLLATHHSRQHGVKFLERAIELMDSEKDPEKYRDLLLYIGKTYNEMGRWFDAICVLEKCRTLINGGDNQLTSKDLPVYADVLFQLANVHQRLANIETARLYYSDALRLYRRIENLEGVVASLTELGRLAMSLNNLSRANQLLIEAITVCEKNHLDDYIDDIKNILNFVKANQAIDR